MPKPKNTDYCSRACARIGIHTPKIEMKLGRGRRKERHSGVGLHTVNNTIAMASKHRLRIELLSIGVAYIRTDVLLYTTHTGYIRTRTVFAVDFEVWVKLAV